MSFKIYRCVKTRRRCVFAHNLKCCFDRRNIIGANGYKECPDKNMIGTYRHYKRVVENMKKYPVSDD